jgi:dihydrofolate reductase
MPKIVYSAIISLDGRDANDSFQPAEDDHAYFNALFAASDAIIFDQPNHDLLVPYWDDLDPDAPEVNLVEGEFARIFRTKPRHVVTDAGSELEALASPITGDVVESIAALRASAGQQLLLACDGDLFARCLTLGLVDEIEALVLPIIAGSGTSPFATLMESHRLRTLEIRSFESGAFVVRYAVA